ncbi:DUF4337 domain-containing protein [Amantichitinum ursilacus]|uniref:DUF4337 domain-containing protein n=1 Tax=Amantichitinum ursilacus TaxID=857265 RepID=A0A0N0GL85_9NEIS|nr:DUF4337 domain-containing protein [Amantichitinum ursilacus]KPC49696.1 hypothetical protein WG78_20275 [Amantichitinum ursilacus]
MAEEKKDPWLNYLALTTVILAVCATLSTFKGGGYSTRGVISQAQASDQWAYYQSKGVKQYLYQIQRDNLVLQREALPDNNKAAAAFDARIADYNKKVTQYDNEKHDIENKARALEAQRDEAQQHGKPFGIAVIFLQVAILISSIAGLFKRKVLWWGALPVGLIGLAYFVDGFFLFM